jgi:hypothetical protein
MLIQSITGQRTAAAGAIGVADHPARQHAAAAAARDLHARRVDVALADDGVDAGHQIVESGPG